MVQALGLPDDVLEVLGLRRAWRALRFYFSWVWLLLVGHTHDDVDRLFARLGALARRVPFMAHLLPLAAGRR